jgi:hypothetical protein
MKTLMSVQNICLAVWTLLSPAHCFTTKGLRSAANVFVITKQFLVACELKQSGRYLQWALRY